ncbi:protein wnt [Plakobranchus ocellatus]|uniref:Protein wnt n=1 Tax=Plakobranchus ocellatus TaxID=259542 RepID=A0AAV4DK93_9GAST|nr:protein wnt [Plakobranchus ocellatus]
MHSQLKESALRKRFVTVSEALSHHNKNLRKLAPRDRCFIQNQTSSSPKRWDRTGTGIEVKAHDQYVVKVDGSGLFTARNRRFLRNFEPAFLEIQICIFARPLRPVTRLPGNRALSRRPTRCPICYSRLCAEHF